MKYFFNWLLGNNWKTKLLFYTPVFIILLILPWYIFRNEIVFDKAHFTEEWCKIIITLSILFIIFEYQKFTTEKNKSIFELKKTIKKDLLLPLQETIQCLNTRESMDILELRKKWIKFYKNSKKVHFLRYNIDFIDERIYSFKETFELKFVNNFFNEIDVSKELNEIDFSKASQKLKELAKLFSDTYDAI